MNKSWDELSGEQAERLESEVEGLRTGHHDLRGRNYRGFFAHAKEIGQLFKGSKALRYGDRKRLWETFNSLCDNVRQEQQRERERRASDSRVKKEVIETDIREAYHWARGSNSISDLKETDRRLAAVLERMKDGWSGFTGTTELLSFSEGKLTKEDRDYLWTKWREAKEAVRERREWLSALNYDHMRGVASHCLALATSDPKAAKDRIKQANGEMKQKPMDNTQYADVRGMLDDAWELASRTGRERHHEWRSKMEDHVERWTELMEKNESVISRLEQQIEECQEMESNARSDDFAETVRGWIEEKMEKIRDIRRTNQELEERIESVKRKLSA